MKAEREDPTLRQETLRTAVFTRTRRQAFALSAICALEGAGAIIWLAESSHEPRFEERLYFMTAGVLGVVSSVLGGYGATQRSRTALLIFFINQLWGLALISTSLLAELRDSRQLSNYCEHLPPGLPAAEIEVDCSAVGGRLALSLFSAVLGILSMWAGAFVAHRLSEEIRDRDVSGEDARLIELILRVKGEVQESAEEFEVFICKRLDDIEVELPGLPAGPPRPGR